MSSKKKKPTVELSSAQKRVLDAIKIPGVRIPHLPPHPNVDRVLRPLTQAEKDYLKFRLSKQKGKEVQNLVQRQADRNKAKVLRRIRDRDRLSASSLMTAEVALRSSSSSSSKTQEQCMEELRKCVEKAPIPEITKLTVDGISKVSSYEID